MKGSVVKNRSAAELFIDLWLGIEGD